MSAPKWRPKSAAASFRHAVEGIAHAFRTQRNMQFHLIAFGVIFLAGMMLRLPRVEMLALVFACALVLMAEMFNTAVEATIDMITESYHPAAKYAKDVAAGAVLIAALTAAMVGAVVFWGAIQPASFQPRLAQQPTVPVFFGAFLLVLLLVLFGKIVGRKGTLLQGGVISGHSAIAFFIAGVIFFIVPYPIVGLLAIALAAMVAQSRVETGVHTIREVVVGAITALAIVALVLRLPQLLGSVLPVPPQ
jgi:diacylglycerol kinase (ATP)